MTDQSPHVIRFTGECDISRYPELRAAFDAIPLTARRIIVDLSETTLVDSTFLAELLFAKRRWDREGRKSAVVVSDKHVYRIMSIANVLEKLRVFADAEHAALALEANGD